MIKNFFGWVKGLLVLVWLVLLLLLGARLAQQNQELVEISLLYWQLPELTTGTIISLAFLVGVIGALLAVLPGLILMKLRLRRLQSRQVIRGEEPDRVNSKQISV